MLSAPESGLTPPELEPASHTRRHGSTWRAQLRWLAHARGTQKWAHDNVLRPECGLGFARRDGVSSTSSISGVRRSAAAWLLERALEVIRGREVPESLVVAGSALRGYGELAHS